MNQNYQPSWGPSQNDFYEPDVDTPQSETYTSEWKNRKTFIQNNKFFVFVSLFGTFSFAALVQV